MTVRELVEELGNLLKKGEITPEATIVLSIGEFTRKLKKELEQELEEWPEIISMYITADAREVNLNSDDENTVFLRGGVEIEIPPIL